MKKGGSLPFKSIRNSNFSYTSSELRKKWVKAAFPAGDFLISAVVQQIPWSTYKYQGSLTLPRISEAGYEFQTFSDVQAAAGIQRPYEYFGGCVFEILQTLYPSPRLRDYVDPTADIDILLHIPTPKFSVKDSEIIGRNDEFIVSDVLADGSPNQLTEHYLSWVFDQICNRIQKIPNTYWMDLFETAEEFDYRDNEEASDAKQVFQRGPVVAVLLVTDLWAKIQILVKFPGVPADHILEFVCPLKRAGLHGSHEDEILVPNRVSSYRRMELQEGQFPVESFASILKGNADALVARSDLKTEKPESLHKYLNHLARQKYLNSLIPNILTHPSVGPKKEITMTDEEYSEFAYAIFHVLTGLFLLLRKYQITSDDVFEAVGNLCEYAFTDKYDRWSGYRIPFYNAGLLRQTVYKLKEKHDIRMTYKEMLEIAVPFFPLKRSGGGVRKTRRRLKKKFETRKRRNMRS